MKNYADTGSRVLRRIAPLGAALVAGLGGLGCAAGELHPTLHVTQAASAVTSARPALETRKPALLIPLAQESTSPRAEGAAYLAGSRAPASASEAAQDDRTATLLSETGRCPAEMSLVSGRVCVDRWEGSLVEKVSGNRERPWSPYLPIDGHEASIRAVSRPGVIPQGYISGKQAAGACQASGKRLCAPSEWETACRGPEHTQFPYGEERRAGVCNDDFRGLHPVPEAAVLLGIPSQSLWSQGMNQAIINQLADTLLATGERAECTNAYGVYDMVGNLHEWVDDSAGTFRGGYYMDTSKNGDGCSYATKAHDFTYHDYSTGFRCCADPEGVE